MRRFLVLCMAVSSLFGEGPAVGGYTGAFIRLGSDARSMALAGALVADINSGFLALTNPASLVFVQRREVGLSYMSLPLDRSLQGLGLALGLPPTAAAGVSYLRAGDDNIQGRNSIGQTTGQLTYNENMAVLSFANRLRANLSMGLNAKLLFINLAEESSWGFALDLGLLYSRPSGFHLAFNAQNVTGSYSWKVAASPGERIYQDYLPLIIQTGVRLPWRHFTFFLQGDAVAPKIKEGNRVFYGRVVPVFRVAIEDLLRDQYFLRIGFENTTFTMGLGLRYTIRHQYDGRVDYSLSLGKAAEGMGHLFTWVFSL